MAASSSTFGLEDEVVGVVATTGDVLVFVLGGRSTLAGAGASAVGVGFAVSSFTDLWKENIEWD